MTTEKNTPKPGATPRPGATGKPRATSKPHAIIEGSVEDVTPKAAKTASPAAKDTKSAAAKPNKSASKAKDAKTSRAEPPGAADRKTGPKSSPAKSLAPRSIGALAAAGLAGAMATFAIIALATAFDGPPRAWLARITGAEDAARLARDAATLTQTTAAKLETALATQKAAIGGLQSSLAAIEGRLVPLEELPGQVSRIATTLEGLGELPAQTTALALRLGAAETRLDTLASNAAARTETVNSLARALDEAAKAGTSSAAVSTGLARTISRLEDAEAQLANLAQSIQKAADAPPPDDSWRRDAEARLTTLRRDMDTLAARLAAEEADAQAARLAAGLAALKTAIDAGGPYADLLTPFGDSPAVKVLAKHAATGAPTIEGLKARLAGLPAQDVVPPGEAAGTLGRIVGLLGGAVKIRRTDDAATAQSPMAAAREALDAGEVARVADIVSQAKQGPEAQAWVEAARARAEIDAAFMELEASLTPRSRRAGD